MPGDLRHHCTVCLINPSSGVTPLLAGISTDIILNKIKKYQSSLSALFSVDFGLIGADDAIDERLDAQA